MKKIITQQSLENKKVNMWTGVQKKKNQLRGWKVKLRKATRTK